MSLKDVRLMSSDRKKDQKAPGDQEDDEYGGDDDDDADENEVDDEAETLKLSLVGKICFRPSEFNEQYIPPTVFFDYPSDLGVFRSDKLRIEDEDSRKLRYSCYWERNCIKNAFVRAGFTKQGKKWTVNWGKHPRESDFRSYNCLQKVNHFPASWCIGRKDRLAKTLYSMRRLHGIKEYSFFPETFVLPIDKDSLYRQIQLDGNSGYWIVKPVASSCGRGIRVRTAAQICQYLVKKKLISNVTCSTASRTAAKKSPTSSALLVQKYIPNPLLISGHKFDLRIYVLVTGVDPLRIYIHHEGLTRLSTSKFSLKNLKNRFAHLTNFSVNKKNDIFRVAGVRPSLHKEYDGESENEVMEGEEEEEEEDDELEEEECVTAPASATVISEATTPAKGNSLSAAAALAKPKEEGVARSRLRDRIQSQKSSVKDEKSSLSSTDMPSPPSHGLSSSLPTVPSPPLPPSSATVDDGRLGLNNKSSPTKLASKSNSSASSKTSNLSSVEKEGYKWSLSAFRAWLSDKYSPETCQEVFQRIDDIIIKTIIAAENDITLRLHSVASYRTHCFELFGFDIILNENLMPSLLEVNVSPSLMGSSPLDRKIKGCLMADILHLVGVYPYDTKLIKKYSEESSTLQNPFEFSSLTKLAQNQEKWRLDPNPKNIDFASLAKTSTSFWPLLLMIEDEFSRQKSTGFRCLHPQPASLERYLPLYRSFRFSDHLLAHWLLMGGLRGRLKTLVPNKFLRKDEIKNEVRDDKSESKSPRLLASSSRTKLANSSSNLSLNSQYNSKLDFDQDSRLLSSSCSTGPTNHTTSVDSRGGDSLSRLQQGQSKDHSSFRSLSLSLDIPADSLPMAPSMNDSLQSPLLTLASVSSGANPNPHGWNNQTMNNCYSPLNISQSPSNTMRTLVFAKGDSGSQQEQHQQQHPQQLQQPQQPPIFEVQINRHVTNVQSLSSTNASNNHTKSNSSQFSPIALPPSINTWSQIHKETSPISLPATLTSHTSASMPSTTVGTPSRGFALSSSTQQVLIFPGSSNLSGVSGVSNSLATVNNIMAHSNPSSSLRTATLSTTNHPTTSSSIPGTFSSSSATSASTSTSTSTCASTVALGTRSGSNGLPLTGIAISGPPGFSIVSTSIPTTAAAPPASSSRPSSAKLSGRRSGKYASTVATTATTAAMSTNTSTNSNYHEGNGDSLSTHMALKVSQLVMDPNQCPSSNPTSSNFPIKPLRPNSAIKKKVAPDNPPITMPVPVSMPIPIPMPVPLPIPNTHSHSNSNSLSSNSARSRNKEDSK